MIFIYSSIYIGIRKNNNTDEFLKETIRIFFEYAKFGREGYARTDQAPFREAAFIMKNKIKEVLLPRSIFCRNVDSDHDRHSCNCNHCGLVHYLEFFKICVKNASYFGLYNNADF